MNWTEEKRRTVVQAGSLSVNGYFRLGNCYEGVLHFINSEAVVFFEEKIPDLMRNPHAEILPLPQDRNLQDGQKVRVRITFIFPSSGMNAELVE